MKANKVRIHEMADGLGVNRQFLVSLIKSMGIAAKNPSSSIEMKQAERVIRKLTRDSVEMEPEFLKWAQFGVGDLYLKLLQVKKRFGVDVLQEFDDFQKGHSEEFQLSKLTCDATIINTTLLAIAESAQVRQLEKILSSVIKENGSESHDSVMTMICGLFNRGEFKISSDVLLQHDHLPNFYVPDFISKTEAQHVLIRLLDFAVRRQEQFALQVFLQSTSLHLLEGTKGARSIAAVLQSKGKDWLCGSVHQLLTQPTTLNLVVPDRILFWAVLDGVTHKNFQGADFLLDMIQDPKFRLMAEYLSSDSGRDDVRSSTAFSKMIELQCHNIDDVVAIASRAMEKIGRGQFQDQFIESVRAWEQTLGSLYAALATVLHQVAKSHGLTSFEVIEIVDPTLVPSEIDFDF